jgi:CRP-like cAMP-binding protein
MNDAAELVLVSLVGLGTNSSVLLGAALGLYVPLPKRILAGLLAFAAGALISALAIDLALGSAQELHLRGLGFRGAWVFVGGGFALGASLYFAAARFLERTGAAVRYPSHFREYVQEREREELGELIRVLAKSDLLRHLPPEEVEALLRYVHRRRLAAGEILFRAGDPGDALYVVVRGKVEVLAETAAEPSGTAQAIAELGAAEAFGEMALLSGETRTAAVRAVTETELIEIPKRDFDRLIADHPPLAAAVGRISHDRAIRNLSDGAPNPETWAKIAVGNLDSLQRYESKTLLTEIARGAGLAIVLGNILDTIPGGLVIGAAFHAGGTLSLSLILGTFLGGIPEAAASAALLRQAGYRPKAIVALWSVVPVTGLVATAAGSIFIAGSASLAAALAQAVAGGAVLAVVVHAMLPEAIEAGRSLIVLPTVAGFLFALYLALAEALR